MGKNRFGRLLVASGWIRSHPGWGFFVLALCYAGYWTRHLFVFDLDTYPFKIPDSYHWLANGVAYLGVKGILIWRSVLSPYIYAIFFSLGLDDWISYLGIGYYTATVAVSVSLLNRAIGIGAAVCAGLLLLTNSFILEASLHIASDLLSAGMGLVAILSFYLALERNPRWFYLWGLTTALGFLAQPSSPMYALGYLAVALIDPESRWAISLKGLKRILVSLDYWGAFALMVGLLLGSWVLQWLLLGVFWPQPQVPRYFIWTTDNLMYWSWSTVAKWTWPVALIASVGAISGIRNPRTKRLTGFLVFSILGAFFFLACVFKFRDLRLVLYTTLPCMVLAGLGAVAIIDAVRAKVDRPWTRLSLGISALFVIGLNNLCCKVHLDPANTALVLHPWSAWVLKPENDLIVSSEREPRLFHRECFGRAMAEWGMRSPYSYEDQYSSKQRAELARYVRERGTGAATLYFYRPEPPPYSFDYMVQHELMVQARCRAQMKGDLDLQALTHLAPNTGYLILPASVYDGQFGNIAKAAKAEALLRTPRYVLVGLP